MTETPTSPSVDGETRHDALYDSAYIAGLNLGFSLGLTNSHEKLAECISVRDGYLAAITRPAPSSPALDPVTVEALADRFEAVTVPRNNGFYAYDMSAAERDLIVASLRALIGQPAPSSTVGEDVVDAKRYRRLRVLGVAPGYTEYLKNSDVLRFTNLDEFVDDDMKRIPSRGEAALCPRSVEAPAQEARHPALDWKMQQPECPCCKGNGRIGVMACYECGATGYTLPSTERQT